MRKAISVFAVLITLISATACGNNIQTENPTTTPFTQSMNAESNSYFSQTESIKPEDLSTWTISQIIECYKNAADVSNGYITSIQNISLNDIVINDGTGMANSIIKMVKPIISAIISGNSTEFSGITGGYTDLNEADVKNACINNSGENTIIKLELNEQTDVGEMNEKSGSVGHAISVIGDLSTVMGQLSDKGLPLEIANENVSAKYTKAVVNVTIDKSGNIFNGTWSYTVTISLKDFKVAGSTVDTTDVIIDNVITYNGGFSE